MNRDLERRLRRLEVERDQGGIRFEVSDWPLTESEWAAGPPYPSGGYLIREQPMTAEEWEATYCHEQPRH
jgi:hypothetical protein